MRLAYLLISITFFVFIGCSTTYKVSKYYSEEKLYKDFNNSAQNNKLEITSTNDSSFYSDSKIEINDDTFYIFEKTIEKKYYEIPTEEIKKIDYISSDYKSADLLLKSGIQLDAENISITKDTIKFLGLKTIIEENVLTPMDNVKSVSYKNHWKGIIPGFGAGIIGGFAIGATGWVFNFKEGGNNPRFDPLQSSIAGAFLGILIGSVVGYIIGYDINYQFNP